MFTKYSEEEVCFVENHAKLSEYRGINILAFLILIQGTGGTKIGKESTIIDA
jgi:hypothetical protein